MPTHATDTETEALISGRLREQVVTEEVEVASVRGGEGGRRPEVATAGDIGHLAKGETEAA